MKTGKFILSALILLFSCYTSAQTVLKGKVLDNVYDRVVMGASVQNISNGKLAKADMGGNYRIEAAVGDRVVFSSTGYITDSVIVSADELASVYDVYMIRNVVELEEIQVGSLNSYQIDSLSRIEEFGDVLKARTGLVGGKNSRPTDGVGITVSPFSHFSKNEKDLRRFKKMYAQQERDYYIDYKFPFNYVAKVTELKGDSLRSFMIAYRPSYELARKNSREDMLLYINDSYRKFMAGEDKNGKKRKR